MHDARKNVQALILGAGISGAITALELKRLGWSVQVVSLDAAATSLSSGAWDLGAVPHHANLLDWVQSHALARIQELWIDTDEWPSAQTWCDELQSLVSLLTPNLAMQMRLERPFWLPSTQGTLRFTFVAQAIQTQGDFNRSPQRIGIVGDPLWNYPSKLLRESWVREQSRLGVQHTFQDCSIRFSSSPTNLETLALLFEADSLRRNQLADLLRPWKDLVDCWLLPPLSLSAALPTALEKELGRPVSEPLCSRETIAGRRLQSALERTLESQGIPVLSAEDCQLVWKDDDITSVEVWGRDKQKYSLRAEQYVLASGRFIGRGFKAAESAAEASSGKVPLFAKRDRVWTEGFPPNRDYALLGFKVDKDFRPWLSASTRARNLRAVGSCIGGLNFAKEKMGLALMALLGKWCAKKMATV